MIPDSEQACFHCGEPVPAGLKLSSIIDGQTQAMCCPGCKAVAELITGSGLQSFYQLRTATNERPPSPDSIQDYSGYDRPESQASFVSAGDDGCSRAQLLVTGISCAACTWLIEKTLQRLDGVEHAEVNLTTQVLNLRWRQPELALSRVFQSLARLGYQAHPWQQSNAQMIMVQQQRRATAELAVAGIAMMQVGMFAIALHAGELQGIADEYRSLLRWVSLLVSSCVVMYSGRSFFRNAWNNIRHGHLVMDLPVAIAISLAWSASAWATLSNSGQVYFDSIAMFTFFLLLGRYLEQRIRRRELLRQVDLPSLLPTIVRRQAGQGWEKVAVSELVCGDLVEPIAGQALPADGTVEYGAGRVDESAFSGEYYPRALNTGDDVAAGTLLLEGNIGVRVSAIGRDTRMGQLLQLAAGAEGQKPALQLFADRLAARFVGAILLISSGVAIYWWQIDSERALWITLSVLVVSCPCALALATPAAMTAAVANLRRGGLIMLGVNTLETLPQLDLVVFDKTGTLTQGKLRIQRVKIMSEVSAEDCLGIASALEQHTSHPIASAFDHPPAADVIFLANGEGQGLSGRWKQQEIRIGQWQWGQALNPQLSAPPSNKGHWIALTSATQTLAWFELGDSVRPEAADVVEQLHARGLRVELLSGDSSDQAELLSEQLNLDAFRKGQSPAQKLDYIKEIQASGLRVAMVGDGLNDAPVLAAADASFAVANATDLAKARADVIVTTNSLTTIPRALVQARRCQRIVRQNFAWAVLYNATAIPFAAMGLVPPWAAAIGMSISSLLVVINSLRLN